MLVKVVPLEKLGEHDLSNAIFHDVGLNVSTGVHIFFDPPAQRDYSQIAGTSHLHVSGVDDKPTGSADGKDYWAVKFAYWYDGDRDTLAVTSGNIYLLSDRGDTVERVR